MPAADLRHTNQFLIFAGTDPELINERLLAYAESTGRALGGPWRATAEPGRAAAELNIGDGALDLDPKEIAGSFAELVGESQCGNH